MKATNKKSVKTPIDRYDVINAKNNKRLIIILCDFSKYEGGGEGTWCCWMPAHLTSPQVVNWVKNSAFVIFVFKVEQASFALPVKTRKKPKARRIDTPKLKWGGHQPHSSIFSFISTSVKSYFWTANGLTTKFQRWNYTLKAAVPSFSIYDNMGIIKSLNERMWKNPHPSIFITSLSLKSFTRDR